MLAKLTAKNQLTLPKSITSQMGDASYFEVRVRHGEIVLTPVRIQRGDAVRAKLAALGLDDALLDQAVAEVRAPSATPAANPTMGKKQAKPVAPKAVKATTKTPTQPPTKTTRAAKKPQEAA